MFSFPLLWSMATSWVAYIHHHHHFDSHHHGWPPSLYPSSSAALEFVTNTLIVTQNDPKILLYILDNALYSKILLYTLDNALYSKILLYILDNACLEWGSRCGSRTYCLLYDTDVMRTTLFYMVSRCMSPFTLLSLLETSKILLFIG